MQRSVFLPFVVAAFASSAWAQLTWERTEIAHTAKADETRFVAEFPFTNEGDLPVTIQSVRTSCGCTTATLNKREYQPGETGTIKAVFEYDTRTGMQRKSVTVRTADVEPVTHTLQFEVEIPKLVEIKQSIVVWRDKEDRESKTIPIVVVRDEPIHLVKVSSSNDAFDVSMKTIEKGRKYEVTVTPNADAKPGASAKVNIITDAKNTRAHRLTLSVMIQKQPRRNGGRPSYLRGPGGRRSSLPSRRGREPGGGR